VEDQLLEGVELAGLDRVVITLEDDLADRIVGCAAP